MMNQPDKADAANPAIAPQFHIEYHWRRVTDLERWAAKYD